MPRSDIALLGLTPYKLNSKAENAALKIWSVGKGITLKNVHPSTFLARIVLQILKGYRSRVLICGRDAKAHSFNERFGLYSYINEHSGGLIKNGRFPIVKG